MAGRAIVMGQRRGQLLITCDGEHTCNYVFINIHCNRGCLLNLGL